MRREEYFDNLKHSELYHHGIIGQKWGVRNGPPYPLKESVSNPKRNTQEDDKIKEKLIRKGYMDKDGWATSKGREKYSKYLSARDDIIAEEAIANEYRKEAEKLLSDSKSTHAKLYKENPTYKEYFDAANDFEEMANIDAREYEKKLSSTNKKTLAEINTFKRPQPTGGYRPWEADKNYSGKYYDKYIK